MGVVFFGKIGKLENGFLVSGYSIKPETRNE